MYLSAILSGPVAYTAKNKMKNSQPERAVPGCNMEDVRFRNIANEPFVAQFDFALHPEVGARYRRANQQMMEGYCTDRKRTGKQIKHRREK